MLGDNLEQHILDICAVSEDLGSGYPQRKTRSLLHRHLANSHQRLDVVEGKFREMGYRVRRQEFPYRGETAVNALFRSSSAAASQEKPNGRKIWIIAHHDYAAGRGAEDNATGLAVMLELAREFHGKRNLVFASFDAEEYGAVGSTYFINTVSPRQQRTIGRVIALKCLGSGRDVAVCTGITGVKSDESVMNRIFDISMREGYMFVLSDDGPFSSGLAPFIRQGIPGAEVFSLNHAKYAQMNGQIRSPAEAGSVAYTAKDQPDNLFTINLEEVYNVMAEFLNGKKQIGGGFQHRRLKMAQDTW